MVRKAGNYFTTAYFLLLFGVYPFYMQDGYRDIATAKYHFLLYISLGAFAILGVLGVIQAVQTIRGRIRNREAYLIDWDGLSITDLLVMLYATEILVSYTLSAYRQEALWGAEGWYMGLVLRLLVCGLYFLVSRFYGREALIWYVAAAAATIVCVIGILDRFSVYLIPLEIRSPEFISTLGNINWICGYLSVLMPVGVVLFLSAETSGKKLFWGVCCGILFMAGFAQGGSSIFLVFLGLFFLTLWIAIYQRKYLADWFLLTALWGVGAQGVRLLRVLLPEGYNYEQNTLCGKLTDSWITLPLIVAGLCGFCLLRAEKGTHRDASHKDISHGEDSYKGGKVSERTVKGVHILTAGGILAGALVWLAVAVYHTRVGIPFLEENSAFLLNIHWGNGRGATLWSGFQVFQKQTIIHKLVGVGTDCFAASAYSLPETASFLREYFGGSRLTNAHNEFLTELVNTGVLGTILYFGIFFSSFFRCMKEGVKQIRRGEKLGFWFCLPAVSLGCYLAHNLVSFAQVLNFPLVLLMIAAGEGFLREKRRLTPSGGQRNQGNPFLEQNE